MSNLNFVDFIILAIFFFSILAGLGRGFVREIVSLITWIVAFVVATTFANSLAAYFTSAPVVQTAVSQASQAIGVSAAQPVSYAALGISFAILFIGTLIAGALVGYFLNIAFQVGVLGIGNRLLGGIFGFVRGFIINLVLIFLVQLSPFGNAPWWHQSQFVASFQPAVQWLDGVVSPSLANLKAKLGQTLQDVNTQFQGVTNSIQQFTK
jgi:membrane protein required for colicin V production